MKPSEVRERILADHERLRRRIAGIQVISGREPIRNADLAELRGEAEALVDDLVDHMFWEDQYLGPALAEADAWGRERKLRFAQEHRRQREWIARFRARLRAPGDPGTPVAEIAAFARELEEDMAAEERDSLDPRVLRDDIVAIDVEAG